MKTAFRSTLLFSILLLLPVGLFAQDLQSVIEAQPAQEAFWSVTIRDMNGNMLESIYPDKLIIPASNQKLFTTAAVLDELGSDYRYETLIYGRGEKSGSTWDGDLIIKGSGDPSISGFLYEEDRYHVFEKFLNQLQEQGIESVSGKLIGDVSLFDDQDYPKGWDWYDFSFYYGVQISPLSFNNNAVDLEVFAEGEIGDTPRIEWFPDSTDYVEFINRQVITHPSLEYDEYYRRALGDNTITLGSGLPQGYFEEESLSIDDPALFFLDSFKEYLEMNGIIVQGEIKVTSDSTVSSGLPVLASHSSRPVSELVAWANKESDNFYVEMMLKTLSAETGEEPGSFEHGIEQVRTYLDTMGIDTTLVMMNDGSGLASGNYTTTGIISDLLYKMQDHSYYSAFYNSLTVAGIDGTLAHRMKGTPLYNNFRGKTGFVTGVRNLSGYMATASGNRIIVSISTNHFAGKVKYVDKSHEEILMYLYENY